MSLTLRCLHFRGCALKKVEHCYRYLLFNDTVLLTSKCTCTYMHTVHAHVYTCTYQHCLSPFWSYFEIVDSQSIVITDNWWHDFAITVLCAPSAAQCSIAHFNENIEWQPSPSLASTTSTWISRCTYKLTHLSVCVHGMSNRLTYICSLLLAY